MSKRQAYPSCMAFGVFFSLVASPAWANRCAWDDLSGEAVCCGETQQALFDSLLGEVSCIDSQSGDSCAWSDVANEIQCCKTTEHAVWNDVANEVDCFKPKTTDH